MPKGDPQELESMPPRSPSPTAEPEAGGIDLTGRRLGDFQVLRRLGQGGMGQVYLAEQVSLKRRVALKILKAELAADLAALRRFQAEAKAVARVTHPNIVQVYATGSVAGVHYIALEYVEGRNLREFLARKGPPDVPLALSIMRQVAAALQRAAELGIIHRDIKPENILLTRQGEVKVADFGLSRCLTGNQPALNLTQSGMTMGTPLYMSPEQVEGKSLDPRTDIYSLGVTCYHMLAGQPPFRGQSAFEVALQHVRAEPEPLNTLRPDLPGDLCTIVHKMMAKSAELRYQSCRELLGELGRLREKLPGSNSDAEVVPIAEEMPLPEADVGLAVPPAWDALGPSTAVFPVRPRKSAPLPRCWWVLVALTVLLALLGGAGLGVGWLRLRAGGHATPVGASGDVGEVNALFSEAGREKFLLQAVEEYANPEGDPNRIRLGIGHCIELTLFYLDRHRLEEASRFFARLNSPDQKVPRYRFLGHLGQAIVLALQDRPVESNETFLQLFKEFKGDRDRDRSLPGSLINQSPRLRMWVGRALDHNFDNATPERPFPTALEYLRKPPGRRGA